MTVPAPAVVLSTSNGVGMGHLTRQLTVALSTPRAWDTTVMSQSTAVAAVADAVADGVLPLGARFEYCHSRKNGWLPPSGWRRTLRERHPAFGWEPYYADRIVALVRETGARAFVHDGVVPYAGLLAARAALPDTAFVWMRRGTWQDGVGERWLRVADRFDLVVEPGDLAGESGPTAARTDALRVAPISMVDACTPVDRHEARATFGMDADRPALLVALGSGAYRDVTGAGRRILDHVKSRHPDWQLVVTAQAIATHDLDDDPDVVPLRGVYPLAAYLSAFDAAVGAAGYNAVHELLPGGVPTLLLPSTGHETDDQVARTAGVAARGLALDGGDTGLGTGLGDALDRLLDDAVRADLRAACEALPPVDGGHAAAAAIDDLLDGRPAPDPAPRTARPQRFGDLRTPVEGGLDGVLFTDQLDRVGPRGPQPVEHLLAAASDGYVLARREAARWLYRSA